MYAEPLILGLATDILSFGELHCRYVLLQRCQGEEFQKPRYFYINS